MHSAVRLYVTPLEDMALGPAGNLTVDFGSFLELWEISIWFKL
jgi:hypothetical protein